MRKEPVIVAPKFGRQRLTSKPLPDKPIRVAFLHPTPFQRFRAALGRTVWRTLRVVVPGAIVFGLAAHDLVIASAYNLAGCNIKGNVSYNGGEKIFHTPGQAYYNETKIALLKGERWFCSAEDARAAGWRRAGF